MKLFISILLLVSSQAWAIKYYQSAGGAISEIDATAFDKCDKIIYRNAAKSELAPAHQKALVKASLKGELVNDRGPLVVKLKAADFCSYGETSEDIK